MRTFICRVRIERNLPIIIASTMKHFTNMLQGHVKCETYSVNNLPYTHKLWKAL